MDASVWNAARNYWITNIATTLLLVILYTIAIVHYRRRLDRILITSPLLAGLTIGAKLGIICYTSTWPTHVDTAYGQYSAAYTAIAFTLCHCGVLCTALVMCVGEHVAGERCQLDGGKEATSEHDRWLACFIRVACVAACILDVLASVALCLHIHYGRNGLAAALAYRQ